MRPINLFKLHISSISILLISCSNTQNLEPDFQALFSNSPTWIEVKSESSFSNQTIKEFVDISNISDQNFKKPTIVRTKTSYRSQTDVKTSDRDEILYSLVECFNFRAATISWNEFLFIPNAEPVQHSQRYLVPDYSLNLPHEIWQQIPEDSSIATYCSKLPNFKSFDNFINKSQVKLGWIPVRIQNSALYHYLKIDDLKNTSNFVPFKLDLKVYKIDDFLGKQYTSTTYSMLFDCKNHRMTIWSETLNTDDFEYKPNPKPTVLKKYNYFKSLNDVDNWELIDTDSFVYKEKICNK